MIDDILKIGGLLVDVLGIAEHLTAAKERREQGLDLTPQQRAAMDAARKLTANEILADIDANIGPEKPAS